MHPPVDLRLRPVEEVLEHDVRLPRDLDEDIADDRREDHAVELVGVREPDDEREVQGEVHDARDDGLPPVLLPERGGGLEGEQHLPRLVDVEVEDHQEGREGVAHQRRVSPCPRGYERLVQRRHHRGAPEDAQLRHAHHLHEEPEVLRLSLGVDLVAEPAEHRLVDDADQAGDGRDDVVVVAVRGDGDEAEEHGDDDVVEGVGDDASDLVQEHRLHVRQDAAAVLGGEGAARLDGREEAPRLAEDQQVGDDREEDRRDDVEVVAAGEEQDEEHDDVLDDGGEGAYVVQHVVAVVDGEDGAAVGEEEVARRRVDEVDDVEDVQVYVRRHVAVDELPQEGEETQPAEEDYTAHPAVDGAVEAQVGACQLAVVVGDGLVHRGDDGGAEAEFREHQHAEDGAEEPVEPEVRGAEEPEEERPVQEGEEQPDDVVDGGRRHVSLHVPREVQLHGCFFLQSSAILCPSVARYDSMANMNSRQTRFICWRRTHSRKLWR